MVHSVRHVIHILKIHIQALKRNVPGGKCKLELLWTKDSLERGIEERFSSYSCGPTSFSGPRLVAACVDLEPREREQTAKLGLARACALTPLPVANTAQHPHRRHRAKWLACMFSKGSFSEVFPLAMHDTWQRW